MKSWKEVWRKGISPLLSVRGLQALSQALKQDDPRLIQGATTSPPPLLCIQDWPIEAACSISYCGWQGEGLETVGDVEEFFAKVCFEVDQKLGEPAACRWFLDWFDETPRYEMRRLLLVEVKESLKHKMLVTSCA